MGLDPGIGRILISLSAERTPPMRPAVDWRLHVAKTSFHRSDISCPMLQVHEVCKTFAGGRGALEVLRDIRFSVSAGTRPGGGM